MSGEEGYFCDRRTLDGIRDRVSISDAVPHSALSFVLLSESFNPIHTEHVRVLEIACAHVRNLGQEVVAAFLSPSSDQYVVGKLGGKQCRSRCAETYAR